MTKGEASFDHRPALAKSTTASDVANAFNWFLGRDVENAATADSMAGGSRLALLERFLSSDEFRDKVTRPVVDGLAPQGPGYEVSPSPSLLEWGARFLPLSADGVERLLRSPTWPSALDALFSDPEARLLLPDFTELFAPGAFQTRLSTLAKALGDRVIVGLLDEANGGIVRGYAFDRKAPEQPVGVELWINGRFEGAKLADEFRRDLQDAHGGSGCCGFTFRVEVVPPPELASERPVKVQVCESGTKLLIGVAAIRLSPRQQSDQLAELSVQLAETKASLLRIEKLLEGVRSSFGFTLSRYDDYWRTYGHTSRPEGHETTAVVAAPRSICVVVDSNDGSRLQLDATLESLKRQGGVDLTLHLLTPQTDEDGIWTGSSHTTARWADRAHRDPTAVALPPAGGHTLVVLIRAGVILEPEALAVLASAAEGGLAYADSDTLVVEPGERSRFVAPQLRPSFDKDLLLQTAYLGDVVAVRRDVLDGALSDGASLETASRWALLLDMALRCSSDGVRHVPKILYHSPPVYDEPNTYPELVAKVLADTAVVTGHSDVLASPIVGVARCIWPLRPGLKASVVIPTRDRLDLLGPCLASILAAKVSNEVNLEVVVVDNASGDLATRRFLNALSTAGQIRIVDYDGPFNWSAINNHAAQDLDADVLIFLNNDTVVLSPDWSDELVRQAMRPEIGAVGARLLYEDGTLQHAGIVLGVGDSLIAHEGIGARPDDRGYLNRRALVHGAAAVTGACMATRRDVFRQLRGFDEDKLAVEGNDIDYCLRVRRAGLTVLYDPYVALYHFESKTRGQTGADPERLARARAELAVLYRRWGEELKRDPYYNPHFERGGPPFAKLGPPPV